MNGLRRAFGAALAAGWIAALPTAGDAQPRATGFQATGTLVAQATIAGSPLNVGGTIAVYRNGGFYRLDLLSLAFPGTDPTASAVAGALLAPGGATLIYNGATGAVSAYSNAHRVYYASAAAPTAGAGTPPPALPAAGGADPLGALAGIARQLHDVVRASILLTGHSVTNGHPTADLDVLVRRQRPGKALEDYHAQLALADDLDGFPVRILLSSTPATPQDFGGSLRLDLTTATAQTPALALFTIPPGYTRVSSLGEILQVGH
jgi:hypothetical protein